MIPDYNFPIIFLGWLPMSSSRPIFPLAHRHPPFFNTNLLDPSRIIKIVQGKHAAIRIFYYQLLKLIFEIDAGKDGEQIDYAQVLRNVMDDTMRKIGPGGGRDYLERYAENVGIFIDGMAKTGELQFQPYLDRNPEADAAFVAVFSQILKQANLENASVEEIFGYLCLLFDLRVNQIEKCVKFQQSDVFVYIESPSQLYLAFLNLQEHDPPIENSIDKGIYRNRQHNDEKNIKKAGKANDTIINIFGDMLHSSKHEGDSKHSNSFITNNLNSSLSPGKRQEEVLTSMKNNYNKGVKFAAEEEKVQEVHDYAKTSDDSKFIKSQSKVQKYLTAKDGGTQRNREQKAQASPDDILYRPKSKLPTISEVTASKESLIYSHKYKKDPLDMVDDDQKGTFYRQFTNTRILNILPEPQRTNVKMLKNRFIGLHSRDLKKH